MTKKNLSPHDRFARSAMSNPKVAEEFFQQNLPESIQKIIDFSSLQLHKESFIDDKLKLQIADLLYSVNFNGEKGFLYILFEHNSIPQPHLPFRMLKYMVAIMEQHLIKTRSHQLPLIYPLILYNGKKPYPYSMDLFDLFPIKEKTLAKEILTTPYHLIDLTQVSDEKLQKYLWFGTMALALKHIHDPNVFTTIKEIFYAVKELEKYGAESYIYTIVTYIAETAKIPHQGEWVKAIQELEAIDQEELMTFMTLIEKLQPEIFKMGIEKGRQKEKTDIAKALLLQSIDLETIAKVTGLPKEKVKEIPS